MNEQEAYQSNSQDLPKKEPESENSFPLTTLEMALKYYFCRKVQDPLAVMTASEFGSYITWMTEEYAKDPFAEISFHDMPDILNHPNIQSLGQQFTKRGSAAKNPKALSSLLSLFDASDESSYFRDTQDITAGRFLRYIPAYWDRYDYFVIYYVLSGRMPVMFEDEVLMLSPGNILFIPPGVQKASVCPKDDVQVLFFMLRRSTFKNVFHAHQNSDSLMSSFFEKALSEDNHIPYLRFQTGQDPKLEYFARLICREYQSGSGYSSQIVNSLMNTFFLFLLRGYEDTAEISPRSSFYWNSTYTEILKYIETNYVSLTINELSARFGYSSRQMIRIIHSITGKSFSQIRTQLRMKQAALLLLKGSVSMWQIAEKTGYANLSSFYRAFHNYYGCTPGDYLASPHPPVL